PRQFFELVLALFRLGAPPVLALPPHREHELRYLVEHSQAVAYAVPESFGDFDYLGLARELAASCPSLRRVLVADGEAEGALALEELGEYEAPELESAPVPRDVALFLLSGGTTGLPKLIPRTHDDYAYNVRASAELGGFDDDTV